MVPEDTEDKTTILQQHSTISLYCIQDEQFLALMTPQTIIPYFNLP